MGENCFSILAGEAAPKGCKRRGRGLGGEGRCSSTQGPKGKTDKSKNKCPKTGTAGTEQRENWRGERKNGDEGALYGGKKKKEE